jgi:hypothetical protein
MAAGGIMSPAREEADGVTKQQAADRSSETEEDPTGTAPALARSFSCLNGDFMASFRAKVAAHPKPSQVLTT